MVLAVVIVASTCATIIIVLPSRVTRDAASDYPAVAQGLRGTAESVGAQVIDALGLENATRTGAAS